MLGKDYKLQPLEKDEKYIDFSSNKIDFLGAIIGKVESGARKLDTLRALVGQNGSRTVVGRDWLRALGIKLKTDGGKCEINLVNKPSNKMFTELYELFPRHGRLEGHEINAQFNDNCVPRHQKGARYTIAAPKLV